MTPPLETPFPRTYQDFEPAFKDRLCQGDILSADAIRLKVIAPESVSGWAVVNSVCDLDKALKTDFFIFCPVRRFQYLVDNLKGQSKFDSMLDGIVKWNSPKAFFLPGDSRLDGGRPQYVEVGSIVTLPIGMDFHTASQKLSTRRLFNLIPPWREKLGERVGNCVSRVGVQEPGPGIGDWLKTYRAPKPADGEDAGA